MIGPVKRIGSPSGKRRLSRLCAAAGAVALALLFLLGASAAAFADLTPPRPHPDQPMRIVRVMSSDPSCQPNCPEWLSLEGKITPGTAAAFAKAIDDLGGRRLPVLISSHGGSVGDALRMGLLIRERRLAVAVARTLIAKCPERGPQCPNPRGQPITGGAACASACPLILAGGVERLVGPVPMVGVHQMTAVTKEAEGSAHLMTVKKIYEPGSADAVVKNYLVAMGVGDPVMALLRKTPPSSIRWLSLSEISASHLATEALDAAAPVLTSGANGLNGRSFEGEPSRLDVLRAYGVKPLALPVNGRDLKLEATFAYRRGGGVVEARIATRDAVTNATTETPGDGWTLTATPGGGAFRLSKPVADPSMGASIPLASFCGFARSGKLIAAPTGETSAGGGPQEPPAAFDFAEMDGATTLVAEACP
jgi:hypothetical protein